MISVLAFNLGLIMMVIMWPLCYWINNGHYIRQYQHHLYDYHRDYFDGGYLLMLDINYISLIVSAIAAGLMLSFEIFCIFYALCVGQSVLSQYDLHNAMITLAIGCSAAVIELLIVSPVLIGALLWHTLGRRGESNYD